MLTDIGQYKNVLFLLNNIRQKNMFEDVKFIQFPVKLTVSVHLCDLRQ